MTAQEALPILYNENDNGNPRNARIISEDEICAVVDFDITNADGITCHVQEEIFQDKSGNWHLASCSESSDNLLFGY